MNRLSGAKIAVVTLILLGIWLVALVISLNIGSVRIPPGKTLALIGHRIMGMGESSSGDPMEAVLFSVRLPRALLGSLVGAALAAAGTAFQSLLRNPLADPYVMGVSTGASLGTILYTILAGWIGFSAIAGGGFVFARPIAAFLGAVLTVGAVYVIAGGSRQRPGGNSQRLLLAGIVLASFLSSINVFLLTSVNQADIRGIFYWLIGDLSRPVDASIYPVLGLVFGGVFLLFLLSHNLNLISLGEEDALILGVDVRKVKTAVYVIASLITGAVVSVSGPIAYIGLICPHLGRMMFGGDNRILIPTVFLFGAIFTLSADTLARTVLSPAELPVGIVTALAGAPLFIYLLHSKRGSSL
ncbi:MAG: iron ABC transporter permease [Acidobacteriota bacterium]|jgi:iron complex transport system permease protein|nr:iron ABC transporter permease [Acidobacteriota bacterium]